jgi:hypothetical protein
MPPTTVLPRSTAGLLALIAALLLASPCLAPQAGPAGPADLVPGLEADQVHARLGQPTRVARQVLAYRCLEQWYYAPQQLRLVFDCPRGQKPRLLHVHHAQPAAP